MKYIIQHVNAYNNQVIREADYNDFEMVKEYISHFEEIDEESNKAMMTILFDVEFNAWSAEYLHYTIDDSEKDEGIIKFRLLFKVKVSNEQLVEDIKELLK